MEEVSVKRSPSASRFPYSDSHCCLLVVSSIQSHSHFFFFGVKSKRSYKSSEPNLTTVSFLFPFFKIMRGSCIVEDVEREVSQIRVENLPSDLFPVSRNMTGPIRVLKKMATATNRFGCEESKKLPTGNIILLPTG